MKILMSRLPISDWWGKGTPVYSNNWSMKLGAVPDAVITKREYASAIEIINQHTDLEIIQFPKSLDTDSVYKHDAIFTRDSFISNQKGDVVISNYSAHERQDETAHLERYLQKNGYVIHTLSQKAYAEGGEFYYIHNGNILLAGTCRNNKRGVRETARHLGVTNVCIVQSEAYHLDTVLTTILDKTGKLIGILVCMELIANQKGLRDFAKQHHIELIEVVPQDAIGFDGSGAMAVNSLALPRILIGGASFITPGVEKKLEDMRIKHIVTPVTQFHLSGGGIHCLTNELRF